ncbi:MAG TPA: sigma-70 family RNA polymerase sigma factor [Planctomycetota bacterium]|nr:sigma-70 family RNA polymerase sigma factor [Planctomycetota bacterium]
MSGTTMQEKPAPALAALEDRELMRLALEDPSGPPFHALYDRHKGLVFRYHLRLVGDRALAEDLMQDTFLRIYERLDRFDHERPFRPWLVQIARNTALNALRSRKKKERSASDSLPERPASDRLQAQVIAGEARSHVHEALASLEDEERALLVDRVGLGMKLGEIAESLGCTERTVRNRLDAAIEHLTRALLGRKEETRDGL